MAKKLIAIVLLAAGVLTAVFGVKAGNGASVNQEIIESAVYVPDGKVLPENEDKIVLVNGTLAAELPFTDEQTGITLDSVVAYRRVEKARIEKAAEEDKKDTWTWDTVSNEAAYGGSKKLIAPGAVLGEFMVSDALMQAVGTNEQRKTYSSAELSALGWNDFKDDGIVYLYKGDSMPYEDKEVTYTSGILGKKGYNYLDYLDTYRVRYDVIKEGADMKYTAIGLQKNGVLEEVKELDLTSMVSGHLNVDEMLEYADTSAATARITAFVIAAVLAALSILVFIRSSKKRS